MDMDIDIDLENKHFCNICNYRTLTGGYTEGLKSIYYGLLWSHRPPVKKHCLGWSIKKGCNKK